MDRNRFKLVGKLVGFDEELKVGILETNIQGASRIYSDKHLIEFANDKLAEQARKAKGSIACYGRLAKRENSDTFALIGALAVKVKEPHSNLALMEGECDVYEFMPSTADGKRQMGRMTMICDKQYFTVMSFRGLAAKLDVRAEMGSRWEVVGRLSPREFEQNGEIRNTVDLIARTAKLLKGGSVKGTLAELEAVAMAFEDGGEEASTTAADSTEAL